MEQRDPDGYRLDGDGDEELNPRSGVVALLLWPAASNSLGHGRPSPQWQKHGGAWQRPGAVVVLVTGQAAAASWTSTIQYARWWWWNHGLPWPW
jgi:hypothetical protein